MKFLEFSITASRSVESTWVIPITEMNTHVPYNTCTGIFTAVSCVLAPNWKQPAWLTSNTTHNKLSWWENTPTKELQKVSWGKKTEIQIMYYRIQFARNQNQTKPSHRTKVGQGMHRPTIPGLRCLGSNYKYIKGISGLQKPFFLISEIATWVSPQIMILKLINYECLALA